MFNVEQFNRVEYTFCNESYSYGVDMNDTKYKATAHNLDNGKSVFLGWRKISDYEYDLALGNVIR